MATLNDQRRFTAEGHMFAAGRAASWIEIAMVAVLLLAILLQSLLGPLTPLLAIGITASFVALRWERVFPTLVTCWPLLLMPILAVVSTIWSDHPDITLRYGILYLLTVLVATLLGGGLERNNLLKGLFIGFAVYIVLSILLGGYVLHQGRIAWAGLMGSKNASGDVGALTVLVSSAMILWAYTKRSYLWLIAALAVIPMGLWTLDKSEATGALIAAMVSLPCLLLWYFSRALRLEVRTTIFILTIVFVLTVVATVELWLEPLFEFLLEQTGKDPGLTGRDVLWRKADELIVERPVLGGGFRAFWVHNNLDAEYLWRYMGIESRAGFSFHNTFREILVDLGITGLAVFVITIFYATLKLFMRAMLAPTMMGMLACALIVFESPRIFFEVIAFKDLHTATVIVILALSHGLRPAQLASFNRQPLRSSR
ncbi:MAG: O-antigen ligase family protein [Erythrobacter sp.]|nr:O-antigen ligase family protein [Erythrobacter sp.]